MSVDSTSVARPRDAGDALWVLAVLAFGLAAGAATASFGALWVAAAIAAVSVVVLIVWRYEIGTVLMPLTLPLDEYGRIITEPVTITLFHVLLLLTLLSWGLALLKRSEVRLRFSAVDVGIAALLFAAAWALPFSLAPASSVIAMVRLVFLWLFTLLFANAMTEERVANWVIGGLVATGLLSAVLAVAQYFVPGFDFGSIRLINQGGGVTLRRVGALFYDPNYLAGFLSIVLILAVAYLIWSRSWSAAVGWVTVAGVVGLGLLVTFSRTGLVAVAAGVLLLVLTAPGKRRFWLAAGLAAAVLVVFLIAPGSVVSRIGSIADVGGDTSVSTRVEMVSSSLEMISDNWAVGTGLDAFERAYPEYRNLGSRPGIVRPHQLPLAIWAEMGLAGLLAELILIGTIIMQFRPTVRGGWSVLQSFAAAGLVTVLVSSLFQYFLYYEYLWLLVAFAIAANRLAAERSETASDSIGEPATA